MDLPVQALTFEEEPYHSPTETGLPEDCKTAVFLLWPRSFSAQHIPIISDRELTQTILLDQSISAQGLTLTRLRID